MRVNPGLSAYSKDPESAGVLLQEPVENGKGRISNEHWVDSEAELGKIPYEKFDTSEEVCEQPNKSSSSSHHKNSNRGGNINGVTNGDSGITTFSLLVVVLTVTPPPSHFGETVREAPKKLYY
ncbi:hypothetical protein C1H46_042617 [Malus baccata]|uniref:Uncharacterized protein n=1 Tax=Malus baccata TaxID=106549 RepID=A0A540KC88_MALBA|nr:hypothetical protein C1H46_042617 [Malus baccata]